MGAVKLKAPRTKLPPVTLGEDGEVLCISSAFVYASIRWCSLLSSYTAGSGDRYPGVSIPYGVTRRCSLNGKALLAFPNTRTPQRIRYTCNTSETVWFYIWSGAHAPNPCAWAAVRGLDWRLLDRGEYTVCFVYRPFGLMCLHHSSETPTNTTPSTILWCHSSCGATGPSARRVMVDSCGDRVSETRVSPWSTLLQHVLTTTSQERRLGSAELEPESRRRDRVELGILD